MYFQLTLISFTASTSRCGEKESGAGSSSFNATRFIIRLVENQWYETLTPFQQRSGSIVGRRPRPSLDKVFHSEEWSHRESLQVLQSRHDPSPKINRAAS